MAITIAKGGNLFANSPPLACSGLLSYFCCHPCCLDLRDLRSRICPRAAVGDNLPMQAACCGRGTGTLPGWKEEEHTSAVASGVRSDLKREREGRYSLYVSGVKCVRVRLNCIHKGLAHFFHPVS